ncbi:hypothetical protein ACFX2I_022636 [Malus domestica]
MSIEDPSDKVGRDRAHSLILIAHRDWQWIVHPDRDRPGGLSEVTKRCSGVKVLEMVGEYNRVKKGNPYETYKL